MLHYGISSHKKFSLTDGCPSSQSLHERRWNAIKDIFMYGVPKKRFFKKILKHLLQNFKYILKKCSGIPVVNKKLWSNACINVIIAVNYLNRYFFYEQLFFKFLKMSSLLYVVIMAVFFIHFDLDEKFILIILFNSFLQLCSLVRLVPVAYLDFKKILETEYTKNGYLHLRQARTLIKIDVNKTRKIYDFLIREGVVRKEVDDWIDFLLGFIVFLNKPIVSIGDISYLFSFARNSDVKICISDI